MNYRSVFYVLGKIMNILGLLMLLPLFVSVYYNLQGFQEADYISFVIPIALLLFLGQLFKSFKTQSVKIYAREGLVICGLGWILVSLFGSLPFIISGAIPIFVIAFFWILCCFFWCFFIANSTMNGWVCDIISLSMKKINNNFSKISFAPLWKKLTTLGMSKNFCSWFKSPN